MRKGRRLILIGVFALVALVAARLVDVVRRVPAAQVARCEAHLSHGWNLDLTLRDGRHLDARPEEVGTSGECPRAGTLIEKRRWESHYRLDGSLVDGDISKTSGFVSMVIAALLFVAVGVVLERRDRQPAPR